MIDVNPDALPAVPGEVLLASVVGSVAYGLAREHSDEDMLGVFLAPTNEVLGLHGTEAVTRTVVRTDPDITLHELGKYCTLALKGNPTVLELLYCQEYQQTSELGEELVAMRDAFLSTSAVRAAYGGYALAQAKRLLRRAEQGSKGFSSTVANRTAKHGRHCYRLLLMGEQLLTTGTLVLDVSEHRDELFQAGEAAAANPDAFMRAVDAKLARLDGLVSVLPDAPDVDRVDEFVVRARRSRM